VWHLAGAPELSSPDTLPTLVDEVLRLYPAGWIGSRVCGRDVDLAGTKLAAGTLVLYSPYLTHHDATLWPDPDTFDPGRFAYGRPAWGYLPFSAGRRTCLGSQLARSMLRAALTPFLQGALTQMNGDPSPLATLTLRPKGPLQLNLAPAPASLAGDADSRRATAEALKVHKGHST
jgi:cytochrome P450